MTLFHFDFPSFAYAFLSILFEGIPFVLLGTLVSGMIDGFLPNRLMAKWLPRASLPAILASGGLGFIFPVCECGIVPVIRRLLGKGLPLGCAITYLLAAPIINPIVALSTFAAYQGQHAVLMTSLRLGLAFLVAVGAGLLINRFAPAKILRSQVAADLAKAQETPETPPVPGTFSQKLAGAVRCSVRDFLDVTFFLVLGAALAALFSTGVDQQAISPLAQNPVLATVSMMTLAVILSLCSTSDAFISATFVAFPLGARLAFLVFGPMFDLKLLFLYRVVFRGSFIAWLVLGLFLTIGLAGVLSILILPF